MQGLDGFGVGAIHHAPAVAPDVDQADIPQHPEMLGYRRLAQPQGRNNLPYRPFLQHQVIQDVPPAGLAHGVERISGSSHSRHALNIYPYRNMSRGFLGARATWRSDRFLPMIPIEAQ